MVESNMEMQPEHRVQTRLEHAQHSDPAMQQQERGVRPIRHPQQHVILARVEDEQRQIREAEDAGAVGDVVDDLLGDAAGVPRVRLAGADADGAEDDVDGDEVEDGEGLASRRRDGEAEDGDGVARAEERGADEVGVGSADEAGWEGDEAEEGQGEWDGSAGD
jgi:hypothetical protein